MSEREIILQRTCIKPGQTVDKIYETRFRIKVQTVINNAEGYSHCSHEFICLVINICLI
jgi:hypothetical protein